MCMRQQAVKEGELARTVLQYKEQPVSLTCYFSQYEGYIFFQFCAHPCHLVLIRVALACRSTSRRLLGETLFSGLNQPKVFGNHGYRQRNPRWNLTQIRSPCYQVYITVRKHDTCKSSSNNIKLGASGLTNQCNRI